MEITVNGTKLNMFDGACVKNAMMRVFIRQDIPLDKMDDITVHDSYGHELDLDAPLRDGQHITFSLTSEQDN